MKSRMGVPKAMTATTNKLARIIYHMVTTQQEYDSAIFQKQEQRRRQQKSARLHTQTAELGFQLVPINCVP
jgi:molybdopterin-guanine dinucleotide biosynthesis protein A